MLFAREMRASARKRARKLCGNEGASALVELSVIPFRLPSDGIYAALGEICVHAFALCFSPFEEILRDFGEP